MLKQLIEHIRSFSDAWITSPAALVDYWRSAHPASALAAAQ
jgi:hypothetical protein